MSIKNIIMKESEYFKKLYDCALLPTGYRQPYPYNLGYYDGVKWTFDCNNLAKAILNGWQPVKQPGYFQADLSKTGDLTDYDLYVQGSINPFNTDFRTLSSHIEALYLDGHYGTYLGKECEFKRKSGEIDVYNVIEATPAFAGGVQFTFVDNAGNRYNKKGGTAAGRWKWHSKCLFLDYEESETINYNQTLNALCNSIAKDIINGKYGNNPDRQKKIVEKFGQIIYRKAQDIVNKRALS